MGIFDFFGIGKKKEVAPTTAGASVLLENTKKPISNIPVATTGAGAVAEIAPQPKIDFFTPKTNIASVPQVGNIGGGSIQTEIPKIDYLAGKYNEPATTEYQGFLGSAVQQATKALTQAGYQTAEHFLRKVSPTEDMVNLVPEKYKSVVRKHFEEKKPDIWYDKLQQKDTELMQNPQFASKFDKGIVTAIKEKDRNTLSNPEFRGEVIGQGLGGAVPSIAIALATKNPTLATMAFFPQMEQDAYEDISTDEGTKDLPEGVREGYAMTVGALNTAIEGIGLNFLTKPFLRAMKKEIVGEVLKSPLKAGIKSVAQSMGSEGLEEVMQQLTSDIMAKVFGSKRNLPSLEELGNIFASASFGVGPISVAGGVTEFDTQGKINKEIMAKPVEKGERFQEQQDMKKIGSNKTEEGKFSIYDIDKNHPGRGDMFTVHEDKNGRIVRNAYVPENMQNKGIATNFYKQMNEKSIENTGNPLRSTQPRKLINGEVVHELSNDGIRLWDGLVEKGLAKKLGEKDYIMVEQKQEQPNKQSEKIAYNLEQKYPVKIDMYPRAKDIVELSKIVVDKNQRNSGIGTKVMQEIIDRADSKGITIALTPDTSLGSSKGRLVDFYKRLGFVANKGKNFQTMESYIREPQQEKLSKPEKEKTSPKKETFTNIEIKAKEKIKYKSISGKSIQDNFYGKLNDTDAEIPMKDGKPEYIYNNSEVNIDNTREGFVGAMKYLGKRLSGKSRILKTPFTFNTDKKTPGDLDIAIDPYGFQEVLPILLIEAKTNAGKPINKIQNGIGELNIFDTSGSKWVKIDNIQENKSKINQLIKNGTIKVGFHYFTDGVGIDVEIFSEAGGMSFDIIGEGKDNDMIPLDIDGIQINTMTPESYKNYVENLLAEDFSKELDDSKTEKFKVAKRINDYIETLEVIASMDNKKGRAWIKQTLTDFIARIFKIGSRNKSFLIDSIKKSNVVKNSGDTEWVDVIERSRSAHKDISGKGKEQLPSVNKFINNTSILKKEIKTELKKTSVNKDKLIKLKKRIQTEFGKYDYHGDKNFHLFNEYYLLNEIYAKRIDGILGLDISNNKQFEPTMERLEENGEEMNALEAKGEFNAGRTVRPIIYDGFEEFPLGEVITKESDIKQGEFMVYDTPKEAKFQEYGSTIEETTKTKEFKNRFGDRENDPKNASKVVDDEGKPLVVYHGTVVEFDAFDKSKVGIESDLGAGFYFTDNEDDVSSNYHGGGPDYEVRVERLAEKIYYDSDMQIGMSEGRIKAREQLGEGEVLYEVFLNIKNPVIIGNGKTGGQTRLFEKELETGIERDQYDSDEEFEIAEEEARNEAMDEIYYKIERAVSQYDVKVGDIMADLEIYEPISAIDFVEKLKKSETIQYAEDENGDLIGNEVIRSIFEELGYDGIIDHTVADKFKNMNIPSFTTHYIAFEPTQIKSAYENKGTFDPYDARMKYQERVKQQPATAEDIAKAQKLLPEATYKTVQQIVNPKTGLPAYGSYLDGMITFAKTLTKTTAYHEVFHAYFDMFTDQKTQREILEIVKREQKIDNDLDAEERLAEKFAEHVINIEKGKDTKGNYKLLDFLDELRAKVKEIFGQGNKIKQLYSDIIEGKRPVKQDMTRQLQKKFKEKSKIDEVLEGMDPIKDDDYTKKGEEYLEIVEPTLKEIEEITAETTNFKTMTDKELEKYYMSGKYDKLSDFEKQEFDNIMNKRVFQDPMQFADPDRQKFIDRIAKLEYKEQRIGMVGKNKISKEKAHQQSLAVDSEREGIIEDIKEHYQFEDTNDAYDMYAQLRDVPVDQIKYEPRKGSYVSKAEKERRVAERVDKTRRETPEEKERRLRSIMGGVVSNARLRGMETTEVKAMLTLLNVNKGELPPPLVQENNLSKDFYDRNKLSEKERKEVLKSKASKDVKEGALNRRSKYIKPIGTQLENISKSVYGRIKKYDYDVLIKGQQDMKDAIPFLEGMIKLKKQNIDDYFSLWLALSNRDVMKAKEIMAKYGIEFPKALLDRIYKEGEEAGFDIGHLEDYFPRVVKDSKGLIGALRRSPERSYIEDAIKRIEEMREEKLTIEEQGEIINALLLGKAVDGVMIGSPNMKERSIELVKKDLLQYYYTPEEALTRYLGSMRDAIEVGKLFGNSGEFETSLGLFIAQEVADGQIQYEDAEKVRELLDAKFEKTKTNPFINWVKTVGYSASLGSFSSTITQLGDLSFSFIENGVNKTLKEYGRSITGRSELKASEFGLNDIGQEFRGDGVAKKVLSTILKGSGFSWMDKRGKETYINSTFRELISKAKKDDKLLNRDLAEYYGETKAKQIMKDLKEGNATDDVRTYIFLKLCNIQPLTATEMPIGYHKNPVFYMLKSFALKQIDYITKKGIKYAIVNPKKGIPRLARIMFFIMLMNGLSDELKNITLGRKYNSLFYRLLNGEDIGPALSGLFWDNFFKMFGLTKYSIYEAKTDGVDKAFSAIFFSVPPLQVPGNIISDIFGMANGKTSFEDLKSIQMIPWVGKPMYRRVGKGQASQQKKMETESKEFAPTRGGL